MCKEQKRRCSFLLLNHRLYYLSISSGRFLVLLIRQKKAQKVILILRVETHKTKKSFSFFQKILNLPLYKIKISGIIIIVRCASVAQSVEQGTENPRVIGSIPIGGTTFQKNKNYSCSSDMRP